MSSHDTERAAIRDAMTRLLDGAPIRSDGKLTIKSLADEAGVKRWILTHRHTDLQDEFRTRATTHGREPEPVRVLRAQLEQARQETTRLRQELRAVKHTCSLLERHIAVDALERLRRDPESATRDRLRSVPPPTPSSH